MGCFTSKYYQKYFIELIEAIDLAQNTVLAFKNTKTKNDQEFYQLLLKAEVTRP